MAHIEIRDVSLVYDTPAGQVTGEAAELLPRRLVRLGELGSKVSTTVNGPDGLTLVEMRPKRGGGSVVLALPRDTIEQAEAANVGPGARSAWVVAMSGHVELETIRLPSAL